MFTKEVVYFLGSIARVFSFYFIGFLSYMIRPFQIELSLIIILIITTYISRFSSISMVLEVLSPIISDNLKLVSNNQVIICIEFHL